MATQIGTIKALMGTATATSVDGTIRTLQVGDRISANDLITTMAGGAVEIEFDDGSVMDMGRNSQTLLDNQVFDPSAPVDTAQNDDVSDDIAAIQQAILEGEDPTEAAEATAAGAGVNGGNEGHEAVFVDYLNPEVTPEAGFDTVGVTSEFNLLEDDPDLNGLPSAGLTTVLLDEDGLTTEGSVDLGAAGNQFLDFLGLGGGAIQNLFNSPAGVGDDRPDIGDAAGNDYYLNGTLAAAYGSDGANAETPIVFNVITGTNVTDSQGNPVTSGGQQVKYWVSADGLTVIGYVDGVGGEGSDNGPVALSFNGEGSFFEESFPQIIFTAQLTPTEDGATFDVGIFGQFDHATPNYEAGEFVIEDNLLLNLGFTVTDASGDTANGVLRLDIDDDSPVRAGNEEEGLATHNGTVYEDSLSYDDDDLSEGNPNAANVMLITSAESDADQSDIENFLGLPAGALEPAVDSNGGDGDAGNGSATKTTLTVEAGDIISFNWSFDNNDGGEFNDFAFVVINGEVFELADSNGGNLVSNPFTYEVTIDGEITIGFGQMNVGDDFENSSLSVSDLTLNGSPVNGGFDDSLSGWDTLGNVDSTDSLINSDVVSGNLNNLVNMGADGPGSFALLQPSENEAQQALFQAAMDSLPTLSSKGEAVSYSINEYGELVATAGEGEGAREVFTLSIDDDGNWTFDLNDQLDHVAGETTEENFSLVTLDENGEPNGSVDSIDFTQLLQIRDQDGDQLIITEDDAGMFTISIKDDIPVVGESNALVDDDGLPNGNEGGIADDNGEASFTGTLNASVGADEPAEFSFAPMDGLTATVGTETVTFSYDSGSVPPVLTATITGGDRNGTDLFSVSLNTETGEYTVDLLTNVLHESLNDLEGDNTENNAFADITYSLTDVDGDTVEGNLNINFDDDMPTVEVASDLAVNFFSESFEGFANISGNNFTVVGAGGGATISGTAGIQWTVNAAGLEIQSGNAGGASASDGNLHAELDTDNNETLLTQLSTSVELPSADVILSFDYQPRPNHEDDSDMEVSFGDYTFTVNSDAAGNVSVDGLPDGVTAELTAVDGGWTTITLQFSDMDTSTAQTLTFKGLGEANEFGAYLDNINMSALPVLAVDESGLDNGNPETGAVTSATADFDFSGYFTSSVGADKEGTTEYSLSLNVENVATGLFAVNSDDTSTEDGDGYGQGAEIVLNEDNGVITGSADGVDYFTISVNDDGLVTLTQLQNIWHDDTANADEAMSMLLEAGTLLLTKSVTDADGDTVSADLDISGVAYRFEDDAPVATENTVSFIVDEDDIRTHESSGNDPYDNDGDGSYTGEPITIFGYTTDFFNIGSGGPATTTGSVAALVSFGADEGGTFSLGNNFAGLEAQNLTSKGDELSFEVQGDTLIASAGGRAVFTLELNENSEFAFSLYDQLDHAEGQGENNLPVDLSSAIVATDADGDSITLESGFVVNVTDDVPEQADLAPDIGIVEEEALPTGNQEINDSSYTITLPFIGTITIPLDGWPDTTVATGSLADQVNVGADDSASFGLSGDYTALIAQNLTSGGEPLTYGLDGNTLYAVVGQTPVFTLKLENNGTYTFSLVGPIDHAISDGENLLTIDLSGIVTAQDFDGDSLTLDQDFYIKIVDDVPEVGYNPIVYLDDDALSGGNSGGVNDDIDAANVAGTLSHSFGADGGSISWLTSGAPNGFSYEAAGDDLLVKQDGTTVLTLTLNPQTGEYSVTQNAPIEHKDNGNNNENNQSFNMGYLVTDGDGDTASGELKIKVDDDTPVIGDQLTATVDDEGLVDGIEGGLNDEVTGVNEAIFTGSLNFSAGADQPATVDFASMDGKSGGVGTETVSYSWDSASNTLTATGPRGVLFTVLVTDTATGDYTVTLVDNVLHESLDGQEGDNTENNATVDLEFTVTDNDGDSQTGNLIINFDDDTPVVTSQQINLLNESFENFAPGLSNDSWTVVGEGGGTIIGNNGIEWTVNGAGIEIQSGNAGGVSASDGDVHAELDAHDSNGDGGSTLTKLSTDVNLPTSAATLSFDFQPRPSDVDGSDMQVSLGGQIVSINVNAAGVIDFGSLPQGVTATQASGAGGWTTITLTFTGLDTNSAQTLSFEGIGSENTLGAYIDNINLNAVVSLTVDESELADGSASTTASFDFSGFFADAFGADGAADSDSESYNLNLNGENVASGLYTVDNTDTATDDGDGYGQGVEIVLNEVNGVITGSAGGVDYFTISVNAESGEVTLTQLQNIWHADSDNPDDSQSMTLSPEILSLVKTITDADGDSAEASVDLGGVSFNFEDDAPVISAQQPTQPFVLTVTNEGGDAGYNNTYGYYIKGENGEPVSGEIIWTNVKEHVSEDISVNATDPSDIGFFIIPDGADLNTLSDGDEVTFQQDGDGNWVVYLDGTPLAGTGTNVLFDNAALNPGNAGAVEDNGAVGNQNWEDTIGGDNDFNDVNINVSISQLGALTVDETDIGNGDPSGATATLDLSGSFSATEMNFGADGPGVFDYSLMVNTDVETGLVDTLSGKTVELRVNGDGDVEGYITTDDNLDMVVFTTSVDETGKVTLTQLRAVEHDDVTDHDEANSPATLNAGAIALGATIIDADGDSAFDSIDVGVLIAFEDDGPTIGEQAANSVDEGNTATGTLVFDAGQDGGGISHINGIALTFDQDGYSQALILDHGTLQVKANGEYSYSVDTASVTQEEVENFTFTVTDNDGDMAQGQVAVNIVNAQVDVVITLNDVIVDEGVGTAQITASVDSPVTGTPLVISLSNGATITIPVNATTGTSTEFSVQGDDPYIDASSEIVSVDTVAGGDYGNIDSSDNATVIVNDTIDTTTVALTAAPNFNEDGTSLTYTLTLGSEVRAGDEAVTVSFKDLLGNERSITINSGTTGTVVVEVPESAFEDVYAESAADLAVATDVSITGGSDFEALGTPSVGTVELTDTIDTTTVTLNDVSVSEDGTVTYSASVNNAPQGNLSITLSNGVVITIADGETTGTSAAQPAQGDDVYVDGESYDVSIASTTGGNYEALDITDTATVTITDTIDTVTATLSTATAELGEDGGSITYTVTLTGAPGDVDPNSPVTFTLANNGPDGSPITITINPGSVTGTATVNYAAADVNAQMTITNSIASVTDAGQYENLVTAGNTSVGVDSAPTISDLTPAADGGDVIVDEDDLADGSDTSKESLTQQGTFTISSGDGIDDLTIDGHAIITDGVFTATSFTTDLGNTLSVTGYNAGTGEISYSYELTDNTLTHGHANDGENGVFENFNVSLSDVDGDVATDILSVQIIDDVPTAAADSVSANEGSVATKGSNLVLMIDTSASVSSSDLSSMKSSLQNLFNSGSVHSVFITSFAEGSTFHNSGENGGWYTNLDDAMSAINALSSSGNGSYGTDYDAALEAVTDNFVAPPPGGGQLVSMFISDGEPNESNGTWSDGIDWSEETSWISFLEANGFDNSYAVGYNGLDSNDIDELEPIAWTPGEDRDTHSDSDDDNVIILDNIDDLADTLASTITSTPDPVTGNVLDNDEPGADGYGTPALVSVTYNGNTVVFTDSMTSATFETTAGKVVINDDGSYEFTGLTDVDADISASIGYIIQDADGDQSSSNLTVTTNNVIPDELYVGNNTSNDHTTSGGNDVLIGDLGGRDQQYNPGSNYSIALIADESGSMSDDRMTLLKNALESFVTDLANHDGVINIGLIGFGENSSLEISVSDLANNPNGLEDLIDEINDLYASGGTNYEAAFDEAVDWFEGQPNGHEFISYFMTDGDPTLHNDGGDGNDTDYETMQAAVAAFKELSDISEVNAIGIGNGVNEDLLRFFDNTNSAGTGTETFDWTTERLANFSGSNDELDQAADWHVAQGSDSRGEVTRTGGELRIRDVNGGAATTVNSNTFTVAALGSILAFDYAIGDHASAADGFAWKLQKQENGNWSDIQSGNLSGSGTIESEALDAGQYRLQYTVNDASTEQYWSWDGWNSGYRTSSSDDLNIDDIELRVPEQVTAPVGEPQIINSAGDLVAQLQEGNTTDAAAELGDDTLVGGDGDDIIIGDTLFTDNLTWTNGDTDETFATGHGLGYEGLVEFLTWAVNDGSAPDNAQIMEYIRGNYESLTNPNPSAEEVAVAGNDLLIGGGGNDILVGGAGADIFQWNDGDQGTADTPATDYVIDFNTSEGDVLDLSDLLDSDGSKNIDASNLDDYLKANFDNGSNTTTVEVFTEGNAQAGGTASQVIVVNGNVSDLNSLLGSDNLRVDNPDNP